MSEVQRFDRYQRALVRQSLIHHRRREEELERLLADVLALPHKNCKCRTCKHLRQLANELASDGR